MILLIVLLFTCVAANGQPWPARRTRQTLWAFWGSSERSAQPELWAEQLSPDGKSAHLKISSWLDAFFASVPADELSPPPPSKPSIHSRVSSKLPARSVQTFNESAADSHAWALSSKTASCTEALAETPSATPLPRRFLVIAPVGSGFDASRWMTHPMHSTYDIVALYYGPNYGSNHPKFECPLCKLVIPGRGAKWYLVNQFMKEKPALWASWSREYEAVMVTDDDLEFDTCTLNRAFEIFSAYNLVMGQQSLCRGPHKATYWDHLYQHPEEVLRYVTFVEIMAPIFSMSFFNGVVAPTLYNAFTGWGLDFLWPFLLRYPRKHVAVIDEVCMVHGSTPGGQKGEGNLYRIPGPYDEREEESRRAAEFGYFPSRVESMGFPYRNMEVLGEVKEIAAEQRAIKMSLAPQQGEGPARAGGPVGAQVRDETWTFLAMAAAAAVGMIVLAVYEKRKGGHDQHWGKRFPKQIV